MNGVYIPAGLLMVGTLVVKAAWFPYAVLLSIALGGYKIFNSRKSPFAYPSKWSGTLPWKGQFLTLFIEPKAVLKPTEFQDFELKEKTVISHNVAMYAIWPSTSRA